MCRDAPRSAMSDDPGLCPERLRVAVYAIARNEEAHIPRWVSSVRDADVIVLGDTGSTDATVDRARELGVEVHDLRIQPFRYDEARNRTLDLVPAEIDICLSLDLDEVLVPGWRERLETIWSHGVTRARCWFEWPWSDVYPSLRFTTADRIHARHGYRWRYPVHEQIVCLGREVMAESAVEIRHHRDSVGSRPQYLEMLRLSLAEHPDDGRVAHLFGCEARLNGLWDEAAYHLRRALTLPIEPNERLNAMLLLAHLDPNARETWILGACAEYPERREPWCALAQLHLDHGSWFACRQIARIALRITRPADDYLTNVFAWGPWPDEMAARASLELGEYDDAVHHARRALRAVPGHDDLAALLHRSMEALTQRS